MKDVSSPFGPSWNIDRQPEFEVCTPSGARFRPSNPRRGNPSRYPFRFMKVGDWFLVPADDPGLVPVRRLDGGSRSHLRSAISNYTSDRGHRFTTARQKDGSCLVKRIE